MEEIMKTFQKSMLVWIMAFGISLFVLSSSGAADACEITVDLQDKAKTVYHVNDEVILKIGVLLTHRNCPAGIDATTYKVENLEVIGATNWEEKATNYFERLVKVQITDSESGASVFHVLRTCDKEGGYNSLKIVVDSAV